MLMAQADINRPTAVVMRFIRTTIEGNSMAKTTGNEKKEMGENYK
jgi:hypothetical protein